MGRNRFKDRKSAGRSEVVPFRKGEQAGDRHRRRLVVNNWMFAQEAIEWCERRDIVLTITNGGHHWKFVRKELIGEWWPSSAKFVFGKKYKNGIHVHDWTQVMKLLVERWHCGTDRHGNKFNEAGRREGQVVPRGPVATESSQTTVRSVPVERTGAAAVDQGTEPAPAAGGTAGDGVRSVFGEGIALDGGERTPESCGQVDGVAGG